MDSVEPSSPSKPPACPICVDVKQKQDLIFLPCGHIRFADEVENLKTCSDPKCAEEMGPDVKFQPNDIRPLVSNGFICSVCNKELTCADMYVIVDCGHCFHGVCLANSLKMNMHCPFCKLTKDTVWLRIFYCVSPERDFRDKEPSLFPQPYVPEDIYRGLLLPHRSGHYILEWENQLFCNWTDYWNFLMGSMRPCRRSVCMNILLPRQIAPVIVSVHVGKSLNENVFFSLSLSEEKRRIAHFYLAYCLSFGDETNEAWCGEGCVTVLPHTDYMSPRYRIKNIPWKRNMKPLRMDLYVSQHPFHDKPTLYPRPFSKEIIELCSGYPHIIPPHPSGHYLIQWSSMIQHKLWKEYWKKISVEENTLTRLSCHVALPKQLHGMRLVLTLGRNQFRQLVLWGELWESYTSPDYLRFHAKITLLANDKEVWQGSADVNVTQKVSMQLFLLKGVDWTVLQSCALPSILFEISNVKTEDKKISEKLSKLSLGPCREIPPLDEIDVKNFSRIKFNMTTADYERVKGDDIQLPDVNGRYVFDWFHNSLDNTWRPPYAGHLLLFPKLGGWMVNIRLKMGQANEIWLSTWRGAYNFGKQKEKVACLYLQVKVHLTIKGCNMDLREEREINVMNSRDPLTTIKFPIDPQSTKEWKAPILEILFKEDWRDSLPVLFDNPFPKNSSLAEEYVECPRPHPSGVISTRIPVKYLPRWSPPYYMEFDDGSGWADGEFYLPTQLCNSSMSVRFYKIGDGNLLLCGKLPGVDEPTVLRMRVGLDYAGCKGDLSEEITACLDWEFYSVIRSYKNIVFKKSYPPFPVATFHFMGLGDLRLHPFMEIKDDSQPNALIISSKMAEDAISFYRLEKRLSSKENYYKIQIISAQPWEVIIMGISNRDLDDPLPVNHSSELLKPGFIKLKNQGHGYVFEGPFVKGEILGCGIRVIDPLHGPLSGASSDSSEQTSRKVFFTRGNVILGEYDVMSWKELEIAEEMDANDGSSSDYSGKSPVSKLKRKLRHLTPRSRKHITGPKTWFPMLGLYHHGTSVRLYNPTRFKSKNTAS